MARKITSINFAWWAWDVQLGHSPNEDGRILCSYKPMRTVGVEWGDSDRKGVTAAVAGEARAFQLEIS